MDAPYDQSDRYAQHPGRYRRGRRTLPPTFASGPSALGAGVRLTIRGRPMVLRRLRVPPTGAVGLLAMLGPGLIAANAGDDAGGIATYASVGAKYGYDLLWMMVVITVSLAIVQEIAPAWARRPAAACSTWSASGSGIGWALLAVAVSCSPTAA